jgi:hypothetical protein
MDDRPTEDLARRSLRARGSPIASALLIHLYNYSLPLDLNDAPPRRAQARLMALARYQRERPSRTCDRTLQSSPSAPGFADHRLQAHLRFAFGLRLRDRAGSLAVRRIGLTRPGPRRCRKKGTECGATKERKRRCRQHGKLPCSSAYSSHHCSSSAAWEFRGCMERCAVAGIVVNASFLSSEDRHMNKPNQWTSRCFGGRYFKTTHTDLRHANQMRKMRIRLRCR